MSSVDLRFATMMRELLRARGVSYRALAARTHYGKSHLHDLASGRRSPTEDVADRLDRELGASGRLAALARDARPDASGGLADEEIEALELARRVAASDISAEVLDRLERAVDELAMAYPTTMPADLLPRVRRHLGYAARLVESRKTVAQHRRLLVVGGWLSLLAATLNIDLRRRGPAQAWLETAASLARHAGHPEIAAWCLETRAWDALIDGDARQAVPLSQRAQEIAPRYSSAHIQATAQEGRAWARIGERAETRAALTRLAHLVAPVTRPDRSEHHYVYDPAKAVAYTATTLAWIGDAAAEDFAREALHQLESAPDGVARPRRVASARLDLGLSLLAAGKADEAAAQALAAVTSGRVVPSNWWRAIEVVSGVERAGLRESADLREAMRVHGRPPADADDAGRPPSSV